MVDTLIARAGGGVPAGLLHVGQSGAVGLRGLSDELVATGLALGLVLVLETVGDRIGLEAAATGEVVVGIALRAGGDVFVDAALGDAHLLAGAADERVVRAALVADVVEANGLAVGDLGDLAHAVDDVVARLALLAGDLLGVADAAADHAVRGDDDAALVEDVEGLVADEALGDVLVVEAAVDAVGVLDAGELIVREVEVCVALCALVLEGREGQAVRDREVRALLADGGEEGLGSRSRPRRRACRRRRSR